MPKNIYSMSIQLLDYGFHIEMPTKLEYFQITGFLCNI